MLHWRFVWQSVQSAVQQSARSPVPSSASHGRGPVPSDHARRDASAARESGLQLPAAQQWKPGRDGLLVLKKGGSFAAL